MKQLNSRIRSLEMPDRMRHLAVSAEGYPIPFFVPYFDGKPEFRGFDPDKMRVIAAQYGMCQRVTSSAKNEAPNAPTSPCAKLMIRLER